MPLPTGKQTSDITKIEEGNYQSRLKGITLQVEKEYQTEAFNDGEGLCYQACTLIWDVDGEEFWDKFVRVSLNEQAKLYNRLAALLGRDLTEEDQVEWKVNKEAEKNIALDKYYKANRDDPEQGIKRGQWVITGEPEYDGIEGNVDDLLINGESVIGKECLLQIGVNAKGYNKADSSAAKPLPKRGARTNTRTPQPQQHDEPGGEDEAEDAPPPPSRGRGRRAPAGAPT